MQTEKPLLSVIIPIYNEKDTILTILEKVQAIEIDKEIIIVDDCSNDGSEEILANLKDSHDDKIKILFHKRNMGKGATIRTALGEARGDIVIIQDADLELDPNDYFNLIKPIIENESKVVFGVRKQEGLLYYGYGEIWFVFLGRIALKLIYLATNFLYNNGTRVNDVMSGYKIMPTEVIKSLDLKSNRFDIETEIVAKLIKKRYKIKEVPINYYPRSYKEGKKIKWYDTFSTLYALLKYKFRD